MRANALCLGSLLNLRIVSGVGPESRGTATAAAASASPNQRGGLEGRRLGGLAGAMPIVRHSRRPLQHWQDLGDT